MRKTLCAITLSVAVLVALIFPFASTAYAEASSPETDFTAESDGDYVRITGYVGPGGDVVVPDTIRGKTVKYIGDYAFSGKTNLKTLVLPDGVTHIGNQAFGGCSSLTAIDLGDGLQYIGDYAFFFCSSLADVDIPDSVVSIGDSAFVFCRSLVGVTVPDGVTVLRDFTFQNCSSLAEVRISENITAVGGYAFYDCSSLESISIPEGVAVIGPWAFGYCLSLEDVAIPGTVTDIGHGAFAGCSSLKSVGFLGDAPAVEDRWADTGGETSVYYIEGKTGFDTPYWSGIGAVPVTAPGIPTGLEASPGNGTVTLSWTAPSSGNAITYEIWFGTDENGAGWQPADKTGACTSTVSGLEPDTTYYFGVKAVNIAGESDFTTISAMAEDEGEYMLTAALFGIVAAMVIVTIWAAARPKR
ncbi:MAG: leucine-rich repeat protein [Candidatus Methanomethylophilaceae archaeon]